MSQEACIDEERNIVISIEKALELKDVKERIFFCKNKNCNARLKICSIDGDKDPYFRAISKNYKHIKGCSYALSNISNYSVEDFSQKDFSFENIMERIVSEKEKTVKNNNTTDNNKIKASINKGNNLIKPATLNHLYGICSKKDINDSFGKYKIWEMIYDERTSHIYKIFISGFKIIKCIRASRFYFKNEKYYYFVFTSLNSCKQIYQFKLRVPLDNKNLCNKMYHYLNNHRYDIFVVAGEWKGKDGNFYCELNSRKQIILLR